MQKNRQINVELSKTINTGNFNSIRFQVGITETIPDDVDRDDAYDELFTEANGQLIAVEEAMLEDHGKGPYSG